MIVSGKVIRDRYHDSVRLLRIGESKRSAKGIDAVGVIMGTPQNLELLRNVGLAFDGLESATANDIVIAVRGFEKVVIGDAIRDLESALDAHTPVTGRSRFTTVGDALESTSGAVLGFIATPGDYASSEAHKFIRAGHPVFVYSDNVPIGTEVELKTAALEANTIVMGPDAGTGMLGGTKVGFANEVRSGPVGILAASGTGAQAISSRLDELGSGVSHIVGLGGRDLTDSVGGLGAVAGISALIRDDLTEVICLVAKDVGNVAARRLIPPILGSPKPIVVYLQHGAGAASLAAAGAIIASSLSDAAARSESAVHHNHSRRRTLPDGPPLVGHLKGLFAGGTLASEAVGILEGLLGAINTEATHGPGHSIVDLGDDKHTQGRPHPMIAPSIQADHIAEAIANPSVGAVMFDVILGYGAHEDPAESIAESVAAALAKRLGRPVAIAGIVIGTERDPQSKARTIEALTDAGVAIFDDVGLASLWVAGVRAANFDEDEPAQWLKAPDKVIVVGTDWFVAPLLSQNVEAIHVDWRPTAVGDEALASILGRLG